jgi:hypothetical protein
MAHVLTHHVLYPHGVTTSTTCTGSWFLADVIHGNIEVLRCSGCAERMVTHNGRRIEVPADITSRKALVRWVRAS